jgi:dynein heavy chain 1
MSTPATDDPGPAQTEATGEMSFDVGVFKKYLSALLPPGELRPHGGRPIFDEMPALLILIFAVMSASTEELEDSMFEDPNFEEKVSRFALDAASRSVYVTKESFMDSDDDG